MAEWVGIVVSGLIGLGGLLLAWKAHRLARMQDDRARYKWEFFAYPTGPTATEDIGLRFTNEGNAVAWRPELDMAAFEGFAVIEATSPACVIPGGEEQVTVTVRHDPLAGIYPKRLRLRWRTTRHMGRRREAWVDVRQWHEVAAGIRDGSAG